MIYEPKSVCHVVFRGANELFKFVKSFLSLVNRSYFRFCFLYIQCTDVPNKETILNDIFRIDLYYRKTLFTLTNLQFSYVFSCVWQLNPLCKADIAQYPFF